MIPAEIFTFAVEDLGFMDYQQAYVRQRAVHDAVVAGQKPSTLLLVEHPPTITFGRKDKEHANLLVEEDVLRARGFSLYDIERGGDITYHGPGQLVGYPIFKVDKVVDYLRQLERTLITSLAPLSLQATGSPGYAGVWLGDDKVAAIGIAVKRHVSLHGFALNVSTDLSHFDVMIPCGIQDKGVTSLSKVLKRQVSLSEIKPYVIRAFGDVFGAAAGYNILD